jgi:glycosyltransferase involved in cell wall biosynthesis
MASVPEGGPEDRAAGGTPQLSVVVPAKDERAGLEATLTEVRRVLAGEGVDYEVLVVDDGSTDGTFERLRELCRQESRLRGIRLSRNYGKESALLAGLREARGAAVVTMDADLQHPPAVIPEMLARWRAGARVVHGVKRRLAGSASRGRLSSRLFNRLVRAMSGIDMRQASDFTLLDRLAVEAIARDLPERRRFFRGLARWVGFPQSTVEFDVAPRPGGGSRWSLRGLVDLAVTGLLSFSSLPLRLVTVLGLAMLVFAALVTAETLWSWFRGTAVSGFATVEITLLFIGSSVMISLGVLGEYVARIYDEVKARPEYLVQDRVGFDGRETGTPSTSAGR